MEKEKIYGIALGLIVIVGLTLFVRQEVINSNQEEEILPVVEVQSIYPEKVVYQMDDAISLGQYKEDCASRDGEFNSCGDMCAPGSEVCAEVCVYTCEFEVASEEDNTEENETSVKNFEDCVAEGNLVMESYPRQCRHQDRIFIENIGNVLEMSEMIQIDSPQPNEAVSSPVEITGQAVGNWFFEGDAPVVITDWDGLIIGEGYIAAEYGPESDMVDFSGTVEFESPEVYDYGTLILQKDNPSDSPENEAVLEMPIKFK